MSEQAKLPKVGELYRVSSRPDLGVCKVVGYSVLLKEATPRGNNVYGTHVSSAEVDKELQPATEAELAIEAISDAVDEVHSARIMDMHERLQDRRYTKGELATLKAALEKLP